MGLKALCEYIHKGFNAPMQFCACFVPPTQPKSKREFNILISAFFFSSFNLIPYFLATLVALHFTPVSD